MFGAINGYRGMNKDMGYDAIPPDLYIHSTDIRITTDKGESGGSWTNMKGNAQAFVIPQTGATGVAEIIGYTTIRDKIILFVADDSDSKGWIYLVKYNPYSKDILIGYPQLLYTSPNLGFSKEWPIEAIGRYENDNIQRVYWTDYNNFLRSVNIADPNLSSLPVGQIDIYPDIEYTQPILKQITGGGNIIGGIYQAAYRLTTSDGKQSLISPPSNLIHVVADSEALGQSAQYTGDLTLANTGKSLVIEIDTSNYSDFDKIELIIIYHSNLNGTPSVQSVEQVTINNASTVEFVYTGAEGSAIDLELLEYTSKSFAFKTCKTLTQEDNSLIPANIKGSSVSVQDLLTNLDTFDAKTYRYNSLGVVNNDVYNLDYNSDAHWDSDWHTNKQFKFQSDGVTLGGEGANISYKFHLEPFTIDGDPQTGFANVSSVPDPTHNLNDGYTYYNTSFPNHTSPFISGLLRGYKRGETYRFGIVFYTKKGEATFVEFIGDIKFPDISEEDGANNDSGTSFWPLSRNLSGDLTTAYSLGIEFTIDFSSAPSLLAQIESYQFVRVKREERDRRRVSQGSIKTFWYAPIASPGGGINFDLRIGGNANVLHLMPFYPGAGQQNATFNTLEDQEDAPAPFTPIYSDYLIKGKYLGFYSPEISYDYNNVRASGTSLTNNPCLLITGAYSTYTRVFDSAIDLTAEGLPDVCQDWRNKNRNTFPVTFGNIENIKAWRINALLSMDDQSTYTEKVTDNFNGYYLRNYYAIDTYNDASADLNDPQGTDGINTNFPEFFRGGTSIIGEIQAIGTDPITGDPVTGSATDWFDAPTNIQVLNPISGLPNTAAHATTTPIVDLVLPKAEIYGGYNNDALEANIFIPASPVIDKTDTNPIVFGGDTFLNMFTLQSAMLEFDTDFYGMSLGDYKAYAKNNAYTELYVAESSLNLDLSYGSTLQRGVSYKLGGSEFTVLRQETNNFNSTNAKTLKMYDYNNLYSKENNDVTFFVKPSSISSFSIVNDIRAYLSDTKINGEQIDNWTKFGVNNYYDVDDYGPINKIINSEDNVFFFQDKAIGVYAINRAAITTTTDGVPTELGMAQGFSKHQYISKETGSIHQWAVKATNSGIYFFDAINRKIGILAGQDNELSEIKGIHSWINALPAGVFTRKEDGGDNPILNRGVVFGRDKINNEIYFTFLSSGELITLQIRTNYSVNQIVYNPVNDRFYLVTTGFTSGGTMNLASTSLIANSTQIARPDYSNMSIAYDELTQSFFTHPSATPPIYIENGDILMLPAPNRSQIYTQGIGNWGEFFGVIEECSITIILNAKSDINKILRTFEFNSIVRDDSKTVDRDTTITAFRIENEWQDTGKVLFSSGRIKRRFEKWRVKIPRALGTGGRLRSPFFKLTLYYDNISNKEIIVNRIISYFDEQIF